MHRGHAGVPGEHDVLGAVLVGLDADGAGLDAQRDVLGHQHGVAALRSEVVRTRQDAVVALGAAERDRQLRLVLVVELHPQGAAFHVDRHGLIEALVGVAHLL